MVGGDGDIDEDEPLCCRSHFLPPFVSSHRAACPTMAVQANEKREKMIQANGCHCTIHQFIQMSHCNIHGGSDPSVPQSSGPSFGFIYYSHHSRHVTHHLHLSICSSICHLVLICLGIHTSSLFCCRLDAMMSGVFNETK